MIYNFRTYNKVFNEIRKATGQLGGNAAFGQGMYGEIVKSDIRYLLGRVEELFLKERPGAQMRFLDIGAGLGKQVIAAAHVCKPALSVGLEVVKERYILSLCNMKRVLPLVETSFTFSFGDVAALKSLNPFNIILMFDAAFEPSLMIAIAKLLENSNEAVIIVSTKVPEDYEEFCVEKLEQVSIHMAESGEGKTARIYRCKSIKTITAASSTSSCFTTTSTNTNLHLLPRRVTGIRGAAIVDPVLEKAINLQYLPKDKIIEVINKEIDDYLSSGRGVRVKKAPQFLDPSTLPKRKRCGNGNSTCEEDPQMLDTSALPKKRKRHDDGYFDIRKKSIPSILFEKGAKVMAVYNSWVGETLYYKAIVKARWYDVKARTTRYDIYYETPYEGTVVYEWGVEAPFLRQRNASDKNSL